MAQERFYSGVAVMVTINYVVDSGVPLQMPHQIYSNSYKTGVTKYFNLKNLKLQSIYSPL